MAEKTINDEIQSMIDHTINQQPKSQLITITKVYEDNNHIDCETTSEDTLEYVPTIASNLTIGKTGVLIILENDEYIVITN